VGRFAPYAKFGGMSELALAANFHAGYAFIPSLDYLTLSNGKLKRLSAVHGAVEFWFHW